MTREKERENVKHYNIIFELVILLNVYLQVYLIKKDKYISVIIIGISIILAEMFYILFGATMVESIINMVIIALQGSLIGRQLLLKSA